MYTSAIYVLLFVAFPALLQAQTTSYSFKTDPAQKRVDIFANGKPFTSYIYPDVLKKPVLFPLRTTKGTIVTRGWPLEPRPGERVDHPHHVGLWFNYGDVNGHDFWNNSNDITPEHKGPFGTIVHRNVKSVHAAKEGLLSVATEWQKPDGSVLLEENTTFAFTGDTDTHVIDRITTLTANEEVTFTDNKEGLIAIRVARELEHPSKQAEVFTDASGNATAVPRLDNTGVSGKYLSQNGKTGDDVWGTRANWVTLNGRIGQEDISIGLLDHPQNTGFPAYWHARGYGLFAANALGRQVFDEKAAKQVVRLASGNSLTFRHRIIIHSGRHYGKQEMDEAFKVFSKLK